jgi:hypothetical protein
MNVSLIFFSNLQKQSYMQALQVDALREPTRLLSIDVNERVSRCIVTPLGTLINRLSFSVVYSRLAIVGALTFDRKLFVSTTILAAFLNAGARMPIETLSAADSQHPFSDFLQFLQHVGRIAPRTEPIHTKQRGTRSNIAWRC